LTAVSAPQADEIEKMKTELLRVRFDEQMRGEKRKSASWAIETQATGALKPWREVVSPHPDVASGRYQQADSPPTSGRCTSVKDRMNTESRSSSSALRG